MRADALAPSTMTPFMQGNVQASPTIRSLTDPSCFTRTASRSAKILVTVMAEEVIEDAAPPVNIR